MNAIFIKLATFVAAVLAVAGIFSIASDLVLREKARIKERLREEFGAGHRRDSKRDLFKDLKSAQGQNSGALPAFWRWFLTLVAQSGLDVTPGRILQISLTLGILAAVLGTTLTRIWWLGAVFALLGAFVPIVYLQVARQARIYRLCEQLPEAFDLMSRAIKAGQTISGAMHLVGTQSKPPISEEFAACCEQQNLGLPYDVALGELARRTGVMELQMFVVVMLVHRTTGGNLGEILENLSEMIRKRIRLRGKVKAATGEGRLQAIVLSALPLAVFVALLIINRPYAQILLDRPLLIGAVLASEALGAFLIQRIVDIRY